MFKRILTSICLLAIALNVPATTSSHKKLAKLVNKQSSLLDKDLSSLESSLLSNQSNSINLFFSTQNLNSFTIETVSIFINGKSISHQYTKDESIGLNKGALHPLFNQELATGEYDITIKVDYVKNTNVDKKASQFFKSKLKKTPLINMFNIKAYQSSDKSPLIIGISSM